MTGPCKRKGRNHRWSRPSWVGTDGNWKFDGRTSPVDERFLR